MELTGKIKVIGNVQTFGNDFTKRDLVILTDEQYPQPINVEFLKDKTDLLNSVKVGDSVKVGINIRGREWTSPQGEVKYFNSIVGWRIEKVTGNEAVKNESPRKTDPDVFAEEDDDLPF